MTLVIASAKALPNIHHSLGNPMMVRSKLVAKFPPHSAKRVNGYISKYMGILDIDGSPLKSKTLNSPSSSWLARAKWNDKQPEKTVLEFQKSLFRNDKNDDWLERSVAHEMIHYRDAVARADGRSADPSQHGASFREGSARVNTVMGSDFVTDEAVKLPTGTFLSMADLKVIQEDFRKKLAIVLGVGGLALLAIILGPRSKASTKANERGTYGTRR